MFEISGRSFTKAGFVRWSQALAFLIDKAQRENCAVDYTPKADEFCGTWPVYFTDKGASSYTRLYTIVQRDTAHAS